MGAGWRDRAVQGFFRVAAPSVPTAGFLPEMPKIIFIEANGSRHEIDGRVGMSVMESAVKNDVPGIDADCGGACACVTCHVYVDPDWSERIGKPAEMEEDMLDFAVDVRENSRLSCQLKITDEFDGLILHLPESQF